MNSISSAEICKVFTCGKTLSKNYEILGEVKLSVVIAGRVLLVKLLNPLLLSKFMEVSFGKELLENSSSPFEPKSFFQKLLKSSSVTSFSIFPIKSWIWLKERLSFLIMGLCCNAKLLCRLKFVNPNSPNCRSLLKYLAFSSFFCFYLSSLS